MGINRRNFLKTAGGLALLTIVPSRVLGGPKHVAPSDQLTKGIIGLTNKGQPRTPEQWGALRAWGWGASRGLDYLEYDPAVIQNRDHDDGTGMGYIFTDTFTTIG